MSDPFHIDLADLRQRSGAKWTRYGSDVLPAWVADMDFRAAPHIRAALGEMVDDSDLGYPPFQAASGVADAFAARAAARWAWEVDPGLVHLLPNVMTGMAHAIEALTEPGDCILVPSPVYHPFHDVAPHCGRVPVFVPLTGAGRLDLHALAKAFERHRARMVLLCHPHNPTGTVHTTAELDELGALVVEHDAWLISDEVHADLTYAPAQHVAAASISPAVAARTVTITAASKAFNLAGLRCALAVSGTEEVHGRIGHTAAMTLHTVGALGIRATLAAWTPAGDDWLAACVALLDRNRQHVTQRVAEDLPGVHVQQPEATYLAWFDCRATGLDNPSKFFLHEASVALSPGVEFGGEATIGFARLNFATTPAVLDLILDRMAEALAASI